MIKRHKVLVEYRFPFYENHNNSSVYALTFETEGERREVLFDSKEEITQFALDILKAVDKKKE